MMKVNFIKLVSESDYLSKWLGVGFESKLAGKFKFRRTVLVIIMHLGLLHALLIPWVPTEDERTLLVWADIGFHMIGQYRYFLTVIDFFFRLNPALMLTYFYFDDCTWLKEADNAISQIHGFHVNARIRKYVRRSKILLLVSFWFVWWAPFGCLLASIYRFYDRNSKYNPYGAYLYISVFAAIDVLMSCKFIIQLYLVCKISAELFDQMNRAWIKQLTTYRSGTSFLLYYQMLWRMHIFAHNLQSYIQTYFLIYLICFFPTCIPFLYVSVYKPDVEYAIRFIFFTLMCYLVWLLVYLSNIIDNIDSSSKTLSDNIYEYYVIESKLKVNISIKDKLIKYFQHVWCSSTGSTIMGQPINLNTSITIVTTFLTILAFTIGNLKHDKT